MSCRQILFGGERQKGFFWFSFGFCVEFVPASLLALHKGIKLGRWLALKHEAPTIHLPHNRKVSASGGHNGESRTKLTRRVSFRIKNKRGHVVPPQKTIPHSNTEGPSAVTAARTGVWNADSESTTWDQAGVF